MINILDIGLGNASAVANIVAKVGACAKIVTDPKELDGAGKIILPGVGAFDFGMARLQDGGWLQPLNDAVKEHKIPVLGICLGMQLMCKGSDEGNLPGLGWIEGSVKKLNFPKEANLKVPHMGWNTLTVTNENPLFDASGEEQRFYFVHSYRVVCTNQSDVIATAVYGENITAAFARTNVFGVQFHPEKSHRFGMALIKRFSELLC